jgi:hypothetical protein
MLPNTTNSIFFAFKITKAKTFRLMNKNILEIVKFIILQFKKFSLITNKFPTSHVEANAQISRPRIFFGINSAKYDHTIGTEPPTL